MSDQTNPAKRLHKILTAVKADSLPNNTPITRVWSRYFQEENPQQITGLWLGVIDLIDSWERLIRANSSVDPTMYLNLTNRIRSALYETHLSGTVAQLQSAITDDLLTNLAFASDATPMDEIVLNDDLVQGLLSEVSEMIEEIVSADLADDLKAILVESAEAMRSALLHYQLLGPVGLRESFYKNVGTRFMHHPEIYGTTLGARIDRTLENIFVALQSSSARDFFKLGNSLARLLTGDADIGADGDS